MEGKTLLTTLTVVTAADSGAGTLRQAILTANSLSGTTTIDFAIGGGLAVIQPKTPLPTINRSVLIDGTSQPGYVATPLIVLDGSLAGASATGLLLTGGNSVVRGLVINNFDGTGLELSGASGNVVQGNFIGTDATGTVARPNGGGSVWAPGLLIDDSSQNTIGGTTAGTRNLISGNAFDGIDIENGNSTQNTILGNLIGTDVSGENPLPNGDNGIWIGLGAGGNSIGGTATGAGNVVSANGGDGIEIDSTAGGGQGAGNLVQGNFVGTDATGTRAFGNALLGFDIEEARNNTIGGTAAGAGNVISGNQTGGMRIYGSNSNGNLFQGNFVGTDLTGTQPIPNNGPAMLLTNQGDTTTTYADNVTIGGTAAGAGNIVANNAGGGVVVLGGKQITILGNSFFGNAGNGVDLGQPSGGLTTGALDSSLPNEGMNVPVITSATWNGTMLSIAGYVGRPNTPGPGFNSDRIEFFVADTSGSGGAAEGKTFIGSLKTDSAGNFAGSLTTHAISGNVALTATATAQDGSTSQFSGAAGVANTGGPTVSTTTVHSSASPSTYGQNITFTATVNGQLGTLVNATGTVTFYDGGQPLGAASLTRGTATLTTGQLAAGPHAITAEYSGDALDQASTSAALSQSVAPAPLTIQANDANRMYGQGNPLFSATFSGLVNGDTPANLAATYSVSFDTPAKRPSGVGTYPITPSGFTDPNYTTTYVAGTLTITPAPLTITVGSRSMVYGGALPPFPVSISGPIDEDDLNDLGTITLSSPATASSPAGTYPVTASGVTNPNYSVTYVSGTLTITPAPLTVRTNDVSRLYGEPNPAFSASFSGLVNGDMPAVLGTPTFSTTATPSSPVGAYSVLPGGLSDPNYTITYAAGTLNVTPAPLTVAALPSTKVYGQPSPAFGVTISGLVNGDTAALLGTPTFSTTATQSSPVGSYAVTPGGLSDSNYAITYTSANLTITPAALTVTAQPASKVYGQPNPAFAATFSGLVNGDTSATVGAVRFSTVATAASPVGRYTVSPGGLTDPNYTVTYVSDTLTITPAPLTVTALDDSRAFGQPNPAFSASYSGLANGDTASALGTLSFQCSADAVSPVGTYPIVPYGLTAPNYTVTYVAGQLVVAVSPTTIALSCPQPNATYGRSFTVTATVSAAGGSSPAPTGTVIFYDGSVALANASIVGGTAVLDIPGLHAGTHVITAEYSGDGNSVPASSGALPLTVAPAPLTVQAVDAGRLYGAPNPAFSATFTGLVTGDTPANLGPLSFATTADVTSGSGIYPVTPYGLTDADYTVTYVPGALTISPAPLTVTTVNASKVYGQPNPAFAATFTGLVNGDTAATLGTLLFSTRVTIASPVGDYRIVPSGLATSNYAVNYQSGVLHVVPAPLTVSVINATKLYGDPNPPFAARYRGLVAGDVPSILGTLSFQTAAGANNVPGSYGVTASGLSSQNYAITYRAGTLTIAPRVLQAVGRSLSATEGAAFVGVVATFTDGEPLAADRYVAEIDWGDGQSSAGTVAFDPASASFVVTGANTYANAGAYAVNVRIQFGVQAVWAAGAAEVADGSLVVSVSPIAATAGVPFETTVGSFHDAGEAGPASDYSATVYWGDGHESAGTLVQTGPNGFDISAGNTFLADGVYAVRVVVQDAGGDSATASGLAVVAPAELVLEGTPIEALAGTPFDGPVATFDANDPAASASDFAVEVAWGDGTVTAGSVVPTGPAQFAIVGRHVYSTAGQFDVAIHVTPANGAPSTADVTARVATPVSQTPGASAGTTLGPMGGGAPSTPAGSPATPPAAPPVAAVVVSGGDAGSQGGNSPTTGSSSSASHGGGPSDSPGGHSGDASGDGHSNANPTAAVQAAVASAVQTVSSQLASFAGAIAGLSAGVDVRTALPGTATVPPSFADLAPPPERLWEALDQLEQQVGSGQALEPIAETVGVGVVAYVGYVLLHTRGGYLLLSLLSSRPLWGEMDPLAILTEWDEEKKRSVGTPAGEDEEEDDSLQSLVEDVRDGADGDADNVAHQPGTVEPYHQHFVRRPRARASARPRGR